LESIEMMAVTETAEEGRSGAGLLGVNEGVVDGEGEEVEDRDGVSGRLTSCEVDAHELSVNLSVMRKLGGWKGRQKPETGKDCSDGWRRD